MEQISAMCKSMSKLRCIHEIRAVMPKGIKT